VRPWLPDPVLKRPEGTRRPRRRESEGGREGLVEEEVRVKVDRGGGRREQIRAALFMTA